MIVDFQHHFTPRELIKADPGDRLILHYDENGAPSYTVHSLLYDLDEHIRMMDAAGIDAAWLSGCKSSNVRDRPPSRPRPSYGCARRDHRGANAPCSSALRSRRSAGRAGRPDRP